MTFLLLLFIIITRTICPSWPNSTEHKQCFFVAPKVQTLQLLKTNSIVYVKVFVSFSFKCTTFEILVPNVILFVNTKMSSFISFIVHRK